MANRFSIEAVFKAVDNITAPVNRIHARMERFSHNVARGAKRLKALDDGMGRVHSGMMRVGQSVAVAGVMAGAAMANVAKTGMDFEQTLTNAAAKFPGQVRKGTDAFAALEAAAKRVGSETEFTASQSAEALNYLAMAGFDVEQSIAALPGVVDLATAAQIELGQATDIATDSLGAFALSTKDPIQLSKNLARINDVMARTTTTANTNMVDMFEAIKEGAPVATAAGASIETFSALVGELANSGIKGGNAGTTLKNVFLRLAAPVGASAAMLKTLGVRTKDAQGNLRDVTDILGDLNKGLTGMGTADRSAALNEIFGKIPIAGVNVLLQSGSERLKQYRAQLENAGGAAGEMAATMRDTTTGDLKSLESAVEGVKLELFDVVSGPLRDMIKGMTDWTRANKDAIKSGLKDALVWLRDSLPVIVDKIERIGKIVGVFYMVAAAVKVATIAMAAFNFMMAANPFVAIGIAIAAVVALLYVFWPEISAFFGAVWEGIKEIFSGASDFVANFATTAVESVTSAFSTLTEFFENLWNGIRDTFASIVGPVVDRISDIVGMAKKLAGFGPEEVVASALPDAPGNAPAGQMVSPQSRIAREISETNTTNTTSAEVTIRDQTGRASITKKPRRGSIGLTLAPSGAL